MELRDTGEHRAQSGSGSDSGIVVVTIADIYRLQQKMSDEVTKIGLELTTSLVKLGDHEQRITAHDSALLHMKGDIVALQTWRDGERQDKPQKANGVTLASVGVATVSCVVAIITLIVTNIR